MRKQELHPRTAIINSKQKNQSKLVRIKALKWLADNFPEAFDNTTQIRPLKKGILQDVLKHSDKALEAGISKSKLREAIVVFTRRIDYLASLKAKEVRVDLGGKPASEVTDEEAENAAQKLKRRIEKGPKGAKKAATHKPHSETTQEEADKPAYLSPFEALDKPQTYYTDRSGEVDMDAGASSSYLKKAKSQPVVIKHKSSRQYDPKAVARLKEKLGLSRQQAEVSVKD